VLGLGGKLAEEFAKVMKKMWDGYHAIVNPSDLRWCADIVYFILFYDYCFYFVCVLPLTHQVDWQGESAVLGLKAARLARIVGILTRWYD
jgi:hypothetical protein